VKGRHSLKFGANFRRYDVSDHNFFNINPYSFFTALNSPTLGGGAGLTGMQAFADGLANDYVQQSSVSTDVPIALWGLGFYGEDSVKVKPNFTLTLALRFEKNANPVCNTNCFANFTGPFDTLPSIQAGRAGAADIPYSDDIKSGIHSAYPGVDAINLSPRIAFSWSPNATDHFPWFPGGNKTVISGGYGLFYDNPPAGMLDNLLSNPPGSVLFNIAPVDSNGFPVGIAPFTQGPVSFAAASKAFNINDSYNQLQSILNPIIGYTPPLSLTAIEGTIHSPQVSEWNLKVDQEINKNVAVSVNYVGNHSVHIPYFNSWWNAYATNSIFSNVLPTSPYTNYGTVRTLQSGSVANYEGITGSVRLQYHSWIMGHINYTFSHALDEVSNGGLFPIGGNYFNANVLTQMNPGTLQSNYGNADYDIRHLFNADYVVTPPTHFQNMFAKAVLGGWQWSGKVFARTGLPFTVMDANAEAGLLNSAPGVAPANIITGAAQNAACGKGVNYTNAAGASCLNINAFSPTGTTGFAYSAWPNQTRNQFRGPGYVDFDMALFKTFSIKERANFGLGAQAFNVFNHPNFNLPGNTIAAPFFGQQWTMQGVPTSPYGNFLGFDSSVRVVQLSLKLTF
jgi:hypothetical protein